MPNDELLKTGLAVAYMLKARDKTAALFRAHEDAARQAKAGFWAQGGLAKTPHDWRKENKRQ
jgi:micrococcal nuclease